MADKSAVMKRVFGAGKRNKETKTTDSGGAQSQWTLTVRLSVQATSTGAIVSNEDKVSKDIIVIHMLGHGTSQARLVIGR